MSGFAVFLGNLKRPCGRDVSEKTQGGTLQ